MFIFCNNSEMEETTLHNSFDMLIKFELRIKNHIQILSFCSVYLYIYIYIYIYIYKKTLEEYVQIIQSISIRGSLNIALSYLRSSTVFWNLVPLYVGIISEIVKTRPLINADI